MNSSLLLDVQTLLIALALITPRCMACMVILPAFGFKNLKGMARNAAAMAMVLPAIVPTYAYVEHTKFDLFVTMILVVKEVSFGGLLGVLLAIPIWVAQSVGSILDTQRSPIQNQANNGSIDQDASALGGMILQALVMVMIEAGLFVALARILMESYAVWPAYTLMPPFEQGHFDVVLKRFGEFFWYTIVYGGPILIPVIMVDFAFAIIGVFASNLQVSSVASPIKSILGLFILLVYWPTFSHYVSGDFAHMLDLVATLVQASPRQGAP
jgi:type III secretion protein T